MWNLLVYKIDEEGKKKKKGNTTDMTLGNFSSHRMFSNRKKGKCDMMSEIYFSVFKKILSMVKLRAK